MATGTKKNGRQAPSNGRNGRITYRRGDPTWDVARVFPRQGYWTEEDYLHFDANYGPQFVELVDGFLKFLPVPDVIHQRLLRYVLFRLQDYAAKSKVGEALMAPCPVRLWAGQMREPDVFFVQPHRIKDARRPPDGVDVAMEIPSPGKENRDRDFVEKRRVYAKAMIPEYWLIDPKTETITVLLPGFSLDVAAVFAAGKGKS
jgi:Uma2 family endonuclease